MSPLHNNRGPRDAAKKFNLMWLFLHFGYLKYALKGKLSALKKSVPCGEEVLSKPDWFL